MSSKRLVLTLTSCLGVNACALSEERRLEQQMEHDLGIEFATRPSLLTSEPYGLAEEGGDRALLRLSSADCTRMAALLGQPAPANPGSEYVRLLAARGIGPVKVVERFSRDERGDHRHYVLEPGSCTLYREAHFE